MPKSLVHTAGMRHGQGVTDTAPELFDRLADRYDQVVPFFAEFARLTVDLLDPPAGTRLLDIGSGRGAIAASAWARGCLVTAVDAAPRMVQLLEAEYPSIDARVMDVHRLDLPAHGYDLVTGGFVIHLVADRARVLGELHRVLRPGGRLALTTPGPCADEGRWDGWNRLVGEFATRATRPLLGHDLDIAAQLREAGFAHIRSVPIEVHLPLATSEACWDFHMSHGFAGVVEALDPFDAAEFRRRALAELNRMREAGGLVLDRGAVLHLATVPVPVPAVAPAR